MSSKASLLFTFQRMPLISTPCTERKNHFMRSSLARHAAKGFGQPRVQHIVEHRRRVATLPFRQKSWADAVIGALVKIGIRSLHLC